MCLFVCVCVFAVCLYVCVCSWTNRRVYPPLSPALLPCRPVQELYELWKLRINYFGDGWNVFDICNLALFIGAIALRWKNANNFARLELLPDDPQFFNFNVRLTCCCCVGVFVCCGAAALLLCCSAVPLLLVMRWLLFCCSAVCCW